MNEDVPRKRAQGHAGRLVLTAARRVNAEDGLLKRYEFPVGLLRGKEAITNKAGVVVSGDLGSRMVGVDVDLVRLWV